MAKKEKQILCNDCKFNKDGLCEKQIIIELHRRIEKITYKEANKTECELYQN